jgi:hypothetical protein
MNLILRNTTYASRNTVQSKLNDYAKRTQFFKKSNVYNINKYNGLQQKNEIGHLVKTNPNKPNSKPIKPNLYCVYSFFFVVKFKTKPKQTQSNPTCGEQTCLERPVVSTVEPSRKSRTIHSELASAKPKRAFCVDISGKFL